MTQEDKRRFTEIGLTFALLITAVCSLQPKQFWQYQLFLAGGSAAGFAFGWYVRKRDFKGIKYFTDAAVLITTAWIGYRIFRSTFLYREVIAILIQGIIVLEVIFSFNFSAPAKAAYMRVLSLLIFIAFPIFPATHSVILAILYLLSWMATLRFQFSGFLQPVQVKGPRRYYSLAAALACFIISLFLAWFTYSNFYLGSIKKWMFLLDEEVQGIGSVEEGKTGGSGQMDELYGMQDSLQEKITNLTLKLDSYEKSREFLYLFSELVKDTENAMEVDKAETGLIDILKSSGIGVEEDAQQAITLTKNYVDKKNALNLQRSKEDIMDMLRKQPVGFLDKVKIISLANKVQQDVSYQELQKNSQELQDAIQKAFTTKYNQKKELGALSRKLADLKAFE
ncbi:MAG: hypothetical protein M0R00_08620, partial [Candidatus Omnitrophica bacterium]|nr:hypothetical protein [Candidatus Omnitrophota bacterium]